MSTIQNPVKYGELKDEQIEAIKRRIEDFQKSNDDWAGLYNEEKWDRGTKTMKSRRVVKPRVKADEISVAVEHTAPRPQKIAVETFSHSVDVYRDKIKYTAEDILFGYDDIVKMCGDTLSEITTQKLNLIKGLPYISSACTVTYTTSCLITLAKAAIILKKNDAKPYARGKYLAICTPELLEKIRLEIEAKGTSMSEPMKEEVESGIVGGYGRWLFKELSNDRLYKSDTVQYLVLMGRRPNGQMPVDVAKIDGVEIIHNPLGSGVLLDADGNITSDDNKQEGSIAVNVNGLGAYVNDDLCILDCEVTVDLIGKSAIAEGDKSGYASKSPDGVEVTLTMTNSTVVEVDKVSGLTLSDSKYYGTPNTVVSVTAKAKSGKSPVFADDKWAVTANKGAKIVGYSSDHKTVFVELANNVAAFTITNNAAEASD